MLALSARSNVLQDFDGGPGQIGIHGRDLLGGTLGQAESHGCMRLATARHHLAGRSHRTRGSGHHPRIATFARFAFAC